MAFRRRRCSPTPPLAPRLIEDSNVHIGILLAPLIAIALWFMLEKSLLGFQFRVLGQATRAARFAGFSENRLVWIAMLISGGLAGLAGLLEATGTLGQLTTTLSPGYGFTAIIVAFLGRLNPLGVIPAGLLLALTYLGGDAAQINLGLPNAVTGIFQGILLFYLLGCDILLLHRVRWHPLLRRRPFDDRSAGCLPGQHHRRRHAAAAGGDRRTGGGTGGRAEPRRRGHDAGRRHRRLRHGERDRDHLAWACWPHCWPGSRWRCCSRSFR